MAGRSTGCQLGICVAPGGSHNLRRSESQPDLGVPGCVCQAAGCGLKRYEESWREGKEYSDRGEDEHSTQAGRQGRVDEGFLGADCESLICAGAGVHCSPVMTTRTRLGPARIVRLAHVTSKRHPPALEPRIWKSFKPLKPIKAALARPHCDVRGGASASPGSCCDMLCEEVGASPCATFSTGRAS